MLGLLVVAVVAVWMFFFGRNRKIAPRCPSCLRLGRTNFYGRHYCSECGADFLLNASGRAVPTFWEAVGQALFLLAVAVASLLTNFTTVGIGSPIVSILLGLGATAQLYFAYRVKKFRAGETTAKVHAESLRD